MSFKTAFFFCNGSHALLCFGLGSTGYTDQLLRLALKKSGLKSPKTSTPLNVLHFNKKSEGAQSQRPHHHAPSHRDELTSSSPAVRSPRRPKKKRRNLCIYCDSLRHPHMVSFVLSRWLDARPSAFSHQYLNMQHSKAFQRFKDNTGSPLHLPTFFFSLDYFRNDHGLMKYWVQINNWSVFFFLFDALQEHVHDQLHWAVRILPPCIKYPSVQSSSAVVGLLEPIWTGGLLLLLAALTQTNFLIEYFT